MAKKRDCKKTKKEKKSHSKMEEIARLSFEQIKTDIGCPSSQVSTTVCEASPILSEA